MDGIAVASTALAMRALRRAVKTHRALLDNRPWIERVNFAAVLSHRFVKRPIITDPGYNEKQETHQEMI